MDQKVTFTEGKILKSLILFAMPVLFALFLQAMYGAVDLLIVGKFASSADVSAVSTGSQIMMTLTNLVSSFAMGTTILLGQQIGSGKKKEGGWTFLSNYDFSVKNRPAGLIFCAFSCKLKISMPRYSGNRKSGKIPGL